MKLTYLHLHHFMKHFKNVIYLLDLFLMIVILIEIFSCWFSRLLLNVHFCLIFEGFKFQYYKLLLILMVVLHFFCPFLWWHFCRFCFSFFSLTIFSLSCPLHIRKDFQLDIIQLSPMIFEWNQSFLFETSNKMTNLMIQSYRPSQQIY